MRKLDKKEILGFVNSKSRTDIITFLSKFENKIYRIGTVNEVTGEGTYDLYESKMSDSFELAYELGIKPSKVELLEA